MQPITVPGRLDSLEEIGKYIMLASKEAGLERSRTYKLRLAVDEIATNIINYGYQQAELEGLITVSADQDDHALTVTLEDTSGYFDPTLRPPPPPEDFTQPLEERGIGGWGVYLALQSVDQFHYHRYQNHNFNIFIMYRATHGNILVIDSSRGESKPVTEFLTSLGYNATYIDNGLDALQLIRQQKDEMVLLNLPLKDKNALDFIKEVKADNALRGIPLMILADPDRLEEAENCITAGAEDYIVLPYSPVVMKARISINLERYRVRVSEHNMREINNDDRDVQIGQQIQRSFFPENLPKLAGWEMAARFNPAREVAGDFYDAFIVSNNMVNLIMGDVCDKGITAALFMALFRSLLRAYSQQEELSIAPEAMLKKTMKLTNDYIQSNHASSNMFATIFFGILDPGTGKMIYINAGHEAPIILNPDGIKSQLKPTGFAVGMMPGVVYEIQQTQINPGEMLMIYTDGVFSAKNTSGQVFGRQRLHSLIKNSEMTPANLLIQIESELRSHIADAALVDDITMLAVKRSS